MGNNLKSLRKNAGLTQDQLGGLCEPALPGVYISRYESGKVAMTQDIILRLSRALKVSPSEILGYDGQGLSEPNKSGWRSQRDVMGSMMGDLVPVVGFVGAGERIYPVDDHSKGDGIGHVPCPPGMNPRKSIAVEVRGDSMEPLLSEGWLIYYEMRVYGVPQEYIGSLCVVKLADDANGSEGATLIKKVRAGSHPGHYHLHSFNPQEPVIEDAMVEWSAKVRYMGQR